MPNQFVITAENNNQIYHDKQFKEAAITYEFDFSPWAEENGTVTTVTWTVKSGDVSVSGTNLTTNVATALLTFSNAGASLVQVKGTNGTETIVTYLDVCAADPSLASVNDYGFC